MRSAGGGARKRCVVARRLHLRETPSIRSPVCPEVLMLRSMGAVVAGFLLIGVLWFGGDFVIRSAALGSFDAAGAASSPAVLVAMLAYVGGAVFGCCLPARLAPNRPNGRRVVRSPSSAPAGEELFESVSRAGARRAAPEGWSASWSVRRARAFCADSPGLAGAAEGGGQRHAQRAGVHPRGCRTAAGACFRGGLDGIRLRKYNFYRTGAKG
jgi:hypothetical protein